MLVDPYLLSIFMELQNDLKPTLSIEVGAYDAEFSKNISKHGVLSYAFEASPFIYQRFKGEMEDINYINKAISDIDGIVQFEIMSMYDPAEAGNNTIKNRKDTMEYEYIDVEAVSLNEYFKNFKDENIALWIDCEGANKEVLTGADKILPKVSSILIETEEIEYWAGQWLHTDVLEYLATFGFISGAQRPHGDAQLNTIFTKKQNGPY